MQRKGVFLLLLLVLVFVSYLYNINKVSAFNLKNADEEFRKMSRASVLSITNLFVDLPYFNFGFLSNGTNATETSFVTLRIKESDTKPLSSAVTKSESKKEEDMKHRDSVKIVRRTVVINQKIEDPKLRSDLNNLQEEIQDLKELQKDKNKQTNVPAPLPIFNHNISLVQRIDKLNGVSLYSSNFIGGSGYLDDIKIDELELGRIKDSLGSYGSAGQVLTVGPGGVLWVNSGVVGTDNQTLSLSGNTLSISNGNSVSFTTDNIQEGTNNLYYTQARFDSAFSAKSTDDLSEGASNLYYTDQRARAALSASGDLSYNSSSGVFSVTTYKTSNFNTDFASKTTDDLAEGSTNLYYTDARVDSRIANSSINTLSDVNTQGASSGQVLSWNGSAWIPTDAGSLETTTNITNTITGNKIADYTNEDGQTQSIYETITSLTQNPDGTLTYTDEAGNQTTVSAKTFVQGANDITVTGSGSQSDPYAVSFTETHTAFSNLISGNAIASFTNENNQTFDINETITSFSNLLASGNQIATYTKEDGTTQNILETVTSIALNGNSLDYTDENGNTNNIDLSSFDKNIYNSDGTLTGDRAVNLDNNTLTFSGGKIGINRTAGTFPLEIQATSVNAPPIVLYASNGNMNASLGSYTSDNGAMLLFDNGGNYKVAIKSVGASYIADGLGIGISNPNAKLHVQDNDPVIKLSDSDNTERNAKLQFETGAGNWLIGLDDALSQNNFLVINTDGTASLTVQRTSGNIGIGTTNPAYKLDVAGTGRFTGNLTLDSDLSVAGNSTLSGALSVSGLSTLADLTVSDLTANRLVVTDTNKNLTSSITEANLEASVSDATNIFTDNDTIPATNIADAYLRNTGDTATGSYNFDNNTFVIDATNNRIGIGTASPSKDLEIYNNNNSEASIKVSGAGVGFTAASVLLESRGAADYRGQGIFMFDSQGGQEWYAGTPYANTDQYMIGRIDATTHSASVAQASNAFFLINNFGNVGIGTTNPTDKLHIAGDMRLEGAFKDSNNVAGTNGQVLTSTGTGTQWKDVNSLGVDTIYTADGSLSGVRNVELNGNNLLFTGTGKIGIATNSPAATLSIGGPGESGTFSVQGNGAGNIATFRDQDGENLFKAVGSMSAGDMNISFGDYDEAYGYNYFTVETDKTYFMNGNVGIGLDSPTQALDVSGTVRTNQMFRGNLYKGYGGLTNDNWVAFRSAGTNFNVPNNTDYFTFTQAGSNEWMRIQNGKVGIATSSLISPLTVASDGTSGITIIDNAGNRILQNGIDSSLNLGAEEFNIAFGDLDATDNGTYFILDEGSQNFQFINGEVGIGVSSPTDKLHIAGDMRLEGAFKDSNNVAGTNGQVLTSTGTGTSWINSSMVGTDNQTLSLSGNTLSISNGNSVSFTTDNIQEGINNLYFTNTRADARADARIAASSIDALADVDTSTNTPTAGQVLKFDGTNWVPAADNDTTYSAGTGLALSGTNFSLNANLSDLNDVSNTTPTNGQVLTWNGTAWVPQTNQADNIYTADGTLTGARNVDLNGNNLIFSGTGNIGIGTTNPINKLQVNGNVRASRFVSASGTAGSPAFRFDSDANTGIFNPGADLLAFTTGGAERLRIDNNGNVGIGTSSPSRKLEVSGNAYISQDLVVNDSQIIYTNHSYQDSTLGETLNWNLLQTEKTSDPNDPKFATITSGTGWKQQAPITRWKIGDEDTNGQHYGYVGFFPLNNYHPLFRVNTGGGAGTNLALGVGTKDVIVIDSNNFYTGVGTDSPTQLLHVAGSARIEGALYDSNNDSGTSGQILSSMVSGTDWVDISTISLGSINQHSDVDTTTTAPSNGDLLTWDGTNWVTTSPTNYTDNIYTADGQLSANRNVTFSGNNLAFDTDKLFINGNNGNIGIGNSAPQEKLDVSGKVRIDQDGAAGDPYLHLVPDSGDSNSWMIGIDDNGNKLSFGYGLSSSGTPFGTAADKMVIDANGNVGIGTTNPAQTLTVNGTGIGLGPNDGTVYPVLRRDASNGGLTISQYDVSAGTYSEKMRVENNGNVGIGITNPIEKLDVAGVIRAGDSSSVNGSLILGGVYSDGYLTTLGSQYSSGGAVLGYGVKPKTGASGYVSSTGVSLSRSALTLDGGIRFLTAPSQTSSINSDISMSEVLSVLNNGNVGIGNSNPSAPLDIKGHIVFDKGNGDVSAGSDIWFNAQGMIASQSNMIFNIDTDNNSNSEFFSWNKNSESTNSDVELMKLTENLGLDVAQHMAIGPNAGSPSENVILRFGDNSFYGDTDRNTYVSYIYQTIPNTNLTANRTTYGHYVLINNNKGGSDTSGERSNGYAFYGLMRNTDSYYAYYNTGGFFEARNESTAGARILRGASALARQYDGTGGSNVYEMTGLEADAWGRSGSESADSTATYGRAIAANLSAYHTDITNADGIYVNVRTNNGYNGKLTNAYGVRAYINSDSDDGGSINNGTAGYFLSYGRSTAPVMSSSTGVYAIARDGTTAYALRATADSSRASNNYGLYLDTVNATSHNYGIYAVRGDWVLDEDGDGISGSANATGGGDLVLGEGQDLFIYHDGTDSFIRNSTGILNILSQASDVKITNPYIDGTLKDNTGSVGTSGQVLVSTGSGVEWQNPVSCVIGGAKVQSDGTVTNSYGIISGVTRTNTGRYTVSFASSLNTSDYYAHVSKEETASVRDDVNIDVSAYNTDDVRVIIHEGDNGTSANVYIDRNFSITLFDANCTALSQLANSDQRLKTNIHDIDKALEKVLALHGVSYNWNTEKYPYRARAIKGFDNKPEIGLIAQEVQEVVPEVVDKADDGYFTLDYGKLVALLVESIKDIWDNITGLKEKVKEIDTLKRELCQKDSSYSWCSDYGDDTDSVSNNENTDTNDSDNSNQSAGADDSNESDSSDNNDSGANNDSDEDTQQENQGSGSDSDAGTDSGEQGDDGDLNTDTMDGNNSGDGNGDSTEDNQEESGSGDENNQDDNSGSGNSDNSVTSDLDDSSSGTDNSSNNSSDMDESDNQADGQANSSNGSVSDAVAGDDGTQDQSDNAGDTAASNSQDDDNQEVQNGGADDTGTDDSDSTQGEEETSDDTGADSQGSDTTPSND